MDILSSNQVEQIINLLVKKISDPFDSSLRKVLRTYIENQYSKFRFSKNLLFRNSPVDFYSGYINLTLKKLSDSSLVNEPFSVLDSFDKIIILGQAGSGKTTLLRYFLLKSIELGRAIPVIIDLRTYKAKSEHSFEDFVASQISSDYLGIMRSFENARNFVFIFDGFDEISYTEDELLIHQLEDFIQKYSSNKFIVSSRFGTNVESLQGFHVFEIQPINDNDIRVFASKTMPSIELRDRFIQSITSDKTLQKNLSTPMLVALYLLVIQNESYNYRNNTKALFFRIVLDSLLSTHDSVSKLAYIREKLSKLEKDDLENVATFIAFRLLSTETFQVSKDGLYTILNQAKKHYHLTADNERLLYDLLVAVNIITESAFCYYFPHVLLMEYLAALFVSRLHYSQKEEVYSKFILKKSLVKSCSFLEFLNELDWHAFQKYYYIPELEKLIKIIGSSQPISREMSIIDEFTNVLINRLDAYRNYGKSHIVYVHLLEDLKQNLKNRETLDADDILNF